MRFKIRRNDQNCTDAALAHQILCFRETRRLLSDLQIWRGPHGLSEASGQRRVVLVNGHDIQMVGELLHVWPAVIERIEKYCEAEEGSAGKVSGRLLQGEKKAFQQGGEFTAHA